jgi:hypothetical protein
MVDEEVELPIKTISLGFEVDSDEFGDGNHMAYPSVDELSRFFRMAGFVWR